MSDQPRQFEWVPDDDLKPARGCLWGMVLSLGIYALAATVAFVIVVVTR